MEKYKVGSRGWNGSYGPDGINATDATLTEIAGNSSSPVDDGGIGDRSGDDSINTVDWDTSKPDGADSSVQTLNGSPDDTDDTSKGSGDDKGATDDKLSRFDQHPRWQEREQKLRDAETRLAALEAENNILKTVATPPKAPTAPEPPVQPQYKDVTKMSPAELKEQMDSDPVGFAANMYMQIRSEVERDIQANQTKMTHEEKVRGTYSQFEKDNPEFKTQWESGAIKQFMDANPGHNPMSAYLLMTSGTRLETARKEAAEAARKEVEKNVQAKKNATTLAGSSGGVPKQDGDTLKDTKKTGGMVATLASRLAEMRRTSSG